MQIALKKQAETYFQSISDFEKAHNQAAKAGELQRFYTLLICRYLNTEQLTSKIVNLYTTKVIQWTILIDAIWGYSLCLAQDSEDYKALAEFVSEIDRKNIVERSFLMKSLPQNLIDSANLEKRQTLEKKAQRAYTKFYYDQKKHNLLRQNNEGFAKLCLLLATLTPSHRSQEVWNKILSLIGNFDLDPDRVLDLLIETFLQSASSQICLKLIKNFNPQSIVALIGNRILKDCSPDTSEKIVYAGKVQNFLTGSPDELYKQLNNLINPKLIILLCKLVKQNTISLQLILPYLNPMDSVFEREQAKRLQNGRQKIVKSFKLMMQQLTQAQQQKIKQEENLKFLGQMLYSSKLALFNGFVRINDWYNFNKFWILYQNKIDLIMYQPLLKSLFQMLQWVIEPLYNKISFNKFFKITASKDISFPASEKSEYSMQEEIPRQMTQITQLNQKEFNKILQIFEIIKIYIGFSSKIFIKICRLFTGIIKQPNLFGLEKPNESIPNSSTYNYIKEKIQYLIHYYLFPGVSLQTGNSALTKEIYQLLELFDYRFRYRCYLYHYSEGMILNPYLAYIFYKTRNKQIIIVNNLSEKNKKVFMKKIAKLTHNQALQTFYWIFRRILMEDYQKVVPEIVAVLSICCTLTLQMSIFVALHILNEQKQPAMNFKTGQQYPWFKNIINFISLFYRKYLEIDIQPVFDYIIMKIGQPVQELEENQQLPGSLLKLLHEILSKMFCNFVLKEVNKTKLEMLCAGPRLQLQAMDISEQIKASKKSKVILEKFFWGKSVDQYDGQSLAISLLVLLTQKRAQVLHKSYISNIKILGDIYDDFTVLIIQLIRVLNELSSGYTQYAKLLPDNALNLLINEYKLPLEVAFEIYRPSIKHISQMTTQEWNDFVSYVGGVINRFITSEEKYINRYGENDKLKLYLNENYTKMNNVMSNEFFTTFWMLTLDSIYFPAKLYTQKIEQVKKKADVGKQPNRGQRNDKNQREIQKARALLTNLKNQQAQQQKKVQDTTSQTNLSRLKVQYLKTIPKDDKSASLIIHQFAQIFVQICLLPRMMLDPQQALYCMKITLEVIKVNRLSSGKSIKLLLFIIEHVMNYLPYSTERQAAYCLAIFLSEILSIISNWNEIAKLKQDLKKFLSIDESFVDENYLRLRKQILKLYVRFGNIVKSIKDQPYSIRNCLFLLEKVDTIPAYKKQAQDIQNYLKLLKQKYSTILPTIIEMQLAIMGQKKKTLPVVEQQGQKKNDGQLNVIQQQQKIQPSPIRSRNEGTADKNTNNGDDNGRSAMSIEKVDDKIIEKKQSLKSVTDEKKISQKVQKQKPKLKQSQMVNESQPIKSSKKDIISLQMIPQQTQTPKDITKLNQQIQQKPILKQNKDQDKSLMVSEPIAVGPPAPEPQKIRIQTVAQKRAQHQKRFQHDKVEKQREKSLQLKPQHSTQRIKTVRQLRDQNARKITQTIPIAESLQSQPKALQPQLNEKLRKENPKDLVPPKSQKQQWPIQEEKNKDKLKTFQPTVQFGPKNLLQDKDKKTNSDSNRNKPSLMIEEIQFDKNKDQTSEKKSLQLIIEPAMETRLPPKQPIIDQTMQIIKQAQKTIQEKRQLDNIRPKQPHPHSKSKDKTSQNRQKDKDNRIEWISKGQKPDKYSQERNQAKQRQYNKRQTRPEYKRDQRPSDNRWKERQDYRDKHNQDREKYKEQKDRMRRKQDKYERQKDRQKERQRERKHEKGKDRSRDRERQYRK